MFVGRKEEGRAVLLSVRAGRGVVLVGPPGYGKTALLQELRPALEAWSVVLWADKLSPFGAFLKDLFRSLWDARIPVEGVGLSKDPEADLKAWGRRYPSNDEKAKSLVRALRAYAERGVNRAAVVVDDATGVQGSMVPWLVALAEAATLVLAVHPDTLKKANTKRLWMRLDRVDLPPLSPKETRALAEALMERYGVVAEDKEAYLSRVAALSAGVPGEVERLVRYVSAEDIVRNRDVGTGYAEGLARREERGLALAPILLVAGGAAIAARYLGLARGEMDLYVAGGLGIALFVVLAPWLRKAVVAQ
ncbi:ATP-binding protein [Thermus caliditerrae]|uniref:ATP-binding protein n=1 Tax=Thermus caliditerrae TaxID=1330700 RepID=UPI002DD41EC8|nr:ATP-binding protein [Thermus caliditerrae]